MADAVMVAVRCRPFNKREIAMGAKCIVAMTGPKTTLSDPSGTTAAKDFTFDFSYWSFDSTSPNFATNPKVYSDLGVSVLNNAWSQTGAGKSYSMVGYGDDKGIVPQVMEEMFVRMANNKDPNVKFMAEASMLEVYNEKIRDLFNPESEKDHPTGLRIRDSPQTGPYVEGLSRSVIKSYKEFNKLLEEGNAVRTVAATQMNATSSRAHTVFQIIFTTTTHDEETGKSSSKTSKINLVDLAGSERLSKTGATGQQVKEGIGINKSLTALGNCIEKLAKKSQVKKGGKDVHVPYRDSVLTWLLKESLGGNSKTIMIAAISPADDNYDESLSTLRYADRAKQIKNSAIINEDENGRIIRELKKEIQALREALAKGGGAGAQGPAGGPTGGMSDKEREEYLALKQQMKQNEELVARMNMSWEEKMKETEEMAFKRAAALNMGSEIQEKKRRVPHMVNLHKDKLMSEALSYFFPVGMIRLCTKSATPPPGEDDIILSGLQIKAEHATAEHVESSHTVFLTPSEGARVFVNGQLIKTRTELNHNDRLILGAHLVFRMIYPNHAADDADSLFDWDYATKEMTTSTIEALNKPDEATLQAQKEQEEKMARMQAEIEAERQKAKEEQEARQKEYERTLAEIAKKKEQEILETKKQIEQNLTLDKQKELSRKLAEREAELERERAAAAREHAERLEAMRREQEALEQKLKAQQAETEKLHRKHEHERRDRSLLEENLMHVIPLVNEANGICTELGQPLRYNIKLEAKRSVDVDGFTERTDVWIRVVNLEDEMEVLWDMETLSEALYLMREIYNDYMRSGQVRIPDAKDENPFHLVPHGPMLIGTARLYLQPCYFLLPIHESTAIIDYRGEHKGQLYVNLVPLPPRDEDQADVPEDELFFEEEEMAELKGEPLSMRLEIKKCMGLPQRFSQNVYVSYRFFFDTNDHQTAPSQGATINPLINYERTLLVDCIEQEFIEYIKTGILEFSVYGEQMGQGEEEGGEEEDDEEAEEEAAAGSGKGDGVGTASVRRKSKRTSTKHLQQGSTSTTSTGSGSHVERLAKLESVLREITQQVDLDRTIDTDRLLQEAPEAIAHKVKQIVSENVELKSPAKRRPDSLSQEENAELTAQREENAKIKAELESLRRRNAAITAGGEGGEAASAAELEALRQAKEEKERALEQGEKELAEMRSRFAEKEGELAALQAKEADLQQELQAKLAAASSSSSSSSSAPAAEEELAQLRKELESARNKIKDATPRDRGDAELVEEIAKKDAELEELRKQLKESQTKKSSACVIL